MSDMQREYEQVYRVLSVMEFSKPVALATISQKTGIRLAELIRISKRLEADQFIRRVTDNGNTFYILIEQNYEERLDSMMPPPENEKPQKPLSSRDAILKRRRSMRDGNTETQDATGENGTAMGGAKVRRQKQAGPEPLSAVDLVAMRKSSPALARTMGGARTSQMGQGLGSTSGTSITGRAGGVFRGPASSANNKAVFVNRPVPRGVQVSRSTFMGMPPVGLDMNRIERSDANFQQINPGETRSQVPLIPFKSMPQVNHEVSEEEVRTALNIPEDMPFLSILSPRPCHDVWKSCSALANCGGGILVLGMRKYVHDGVVSYYIKTVNRPEDCIKQLLKSFNDRNIISDCPKDPNFIEVKDLEKKKVLVLRIDPAQLSPAPLFIARDSFGMRTHNGCYIYKDGEVVHCTEEESKQLWEKLRAGSEEIDWEQTGEVIEVPMERKVKLHLPQVIDDAVRPLSRSECTYGQALPQLDLPANMRGYAAKPDFRNRPDYLPFEPTEEEILRKEAAAKALAMPLPKKKKSKKKDRSLKMPFEALVHDGSVDHMTHRSKVSEQSAENKDKVLNSLLFAEDIRVSSNKTNFSTIEPQVVDSPSLQSSVATTTQAKVAQAIAAQSRATQVKVAQAKTIQSSSPSAKVEMRAPAKVEKPAPASTPAPAPVVADADMPPMLADADRAKLDEIALPTVNHPRLPSARLCEIAITLCQHARLKPAELAELLHRKLVPVRDKVMPSIKEHPNVHCVDNIYYYIDKN